MTLWRPSRRALLKTSAISAAGALTGAPRIVRADPKEVVVGGPAGAAKYFNSDVFPLIEKKLGIKVIYEGTNSLTNLQKMTADKDAPKMSVVIMDDPVMLVAAKEGLITLSPSQAHPILPNSPPPTSIRMECGRTTRCRGRGSPLTPRAARRRRARTTCMPRGGGQGHHPFAQKYGGLLGPSFRCPPRDRQALQGCAI
jgi:hypothetical protein